MKCYLIHEENIDFPSMENPIEYITFKNKKSQNVSKFIINREFFYGKIDNEGIYEHCTLYFSNNQYNINKATFSQLIILGWVPIENIKKYTFS